MAKLISLSDSFEISLRQKAKGLRDAPALTTTFRVELVDCIYHGPLDRLAAQYLERIVHCL